MFLNITYNGVSADVEVPLDNAATDANIKTIAAEILRSGDIENMRHPNVTSADFEHFTVHRSRTPQDQERVLLCPKAAYGTDYTSSAPCSVCGEPMNDLMAMARCLDRWKPSRRSYAK